MTATTRASVDRGPYFDPCDVELNLDPDPVFARRRDEARTAARLEGCIALEEILKRFPECDVDLGNALLPPTSTLRGADNMPAVAE